MADPCSCSSLSGLSLTLAPLQMVTAWQLETQSSRAAALKHGRPRIAPLLELAWPATSPVHLAIQHYGWLLQSDASQSSVWLCLQGPQFDQSWASRAVLLERLHRMLLTAAAGLWIRTTHVFHAWPWRLLLLADQRRSDQEHIARDFFSSPTCCLPQAFCGTLRRMIVSELRVELGIDSPSMSQAISALLGTKWATLLRVVADDLDFSTADIECSHSLCRQFCRGSSSVGMESLAAAYCLHEAKHLFAVASSNKKLAAQRNEAVGNTQGRRPKWTGAQLFHHHRLNAQPSSLSHDPCSLEAWKVTRARWHNMREDQRQAYDRLASIPGRSPIAHVCKQLDAAVVSNSAAPAMCSSDAVLGHCVLPTTVLTPAGLQHLDPGVDTLPLPLREFEHALGVSSAKQRALAWDAQHSVPIGPHMPGVSSHLEPKCCCESNGVCITRWKLSLAKLRKAQQTLNLLSVPISSPCDEDSVLPTGPFSLLAFESVRSASSSSILRLGLVVWASSNPKFQVLLEHAFVGASDNPVEGLPPFPFQLDPCFLEHIESDLASAKRFASPGAGQPRFIHCAAWLESLFEGPTCTRTWFVHRLNYTLAAAACSSSQCPFGRLVVVSKGESCELVNLRSSGNTRQSAAALRALQSIGGRACVASLPTSGVQPDLEDWTDHCIADDAGPGSASDDEAVSTELRDIVDDPLGDSVLAAMEVLQGRIEGEAMFVEIHGLQARLGTSSGPAASSCSPSSSSSIALQALDACGPQPPFVGFYQTQAHKGYVLDASGRPIGRITEWAKSRAVRCGFHSKNGCKCGRTWPVARAPPYGVIIKWLQSAPLHGLHSGHMVTCPV